MERQAIFITGAASGIGRATALQFYQRGWFVGAVDVDEATKVALKGLVRSNPKNYAMNS